jgi:hypothetical protein
MTQTRNRFKKKLGVKWIQGESGETYLCPVEALDKLTDPGEDQLRMICIVESANPQNN